MKKIFLFIFLMFMFVVEINAEACDAADIKRLKEIANGIEITYELQAPFEDSFGDIINDSYNIFITGLSDKFYFKFIDDENGVINFENKNILNDDIITIGDWLSGNYRIDIYYKECDFLIRKINIELPKYNFYYDNSICNDYKDKLNVCSKWYSGRVDKNIIENEIKKYEENNKSFFEKYFIYIVVIFVFIMFLIILKILKHRKEVLK